MGLMQQAYQTYCMMEKRYAGVYEEGRQPLAPVSHLLTTPAIEITLDRDGNFINAAAWEKNGGKIIIPVTEESAGRAAVPAAHPLCEQIGYLCGTDAKKYALYVEQLQDWASSEWSHPKLKAILHYVKSGSIIKDLVGCGLMEVSEKGKPKDEKLLICWRVLDPGSDAPPECWRDPTLFTAFINYYSSVQQPQSDLCMISGSIDQLASQHPKGVVSLYGNAKIISANDTSGFTYRGRFTDKRQAATVGYTVSQKAHAALRWLVSNEGRTIGGRTFLCWSPQGVAVPQVTSPFLRSSEAAILQPSDYRLALRRTLQGDREQLSVHDSAVVAAFDAATTGRLSVTYYSELQASDFLQRLHDWDNSCCWWNGKFGLQPPRLQTIIDCAYGTQREEKGRAVFKADDAILGQQLQRLIACRVDSGRMPADLMARLVNRASTPQAYDPGLWRQLVFVTCAVIQKYHSPRLKEDLCMEWKLDRKDRSFQFGRLLAVMERAEDDYYNNIGESRQTNAIKSIAAFRQTPWTVFARINEMLEGAYLPRIKQWQRDRYHRLRDEISVNLSEYGDALNKPLNEFYLMGYELQRNEFFRKKEATDNGMTEYEEE